MTTQPLAPPPPPPPSGGGGTRTIDFGRPFTYVFEDPRWLTKVLIGGLMYILAFLIVGAFFIAGYAARLARNVAAGVPQPLPEWDQWGDDFVEGLRIAGVLLVYYVPIMLIAFVAFGGGAALSAIMAESGSDAGAIAGSGLMSVGVCLFYALILVLMVIMPAVMLLVVMRRSFSAGFDFPAIFAYIRSNLANYVLALAIYFIAGFIGQFGVILLCIGVVFTSFWALLATTYAFAEGYRFSKVK